MTYHSGPTTFRTKGDAQAWLAEERRLISLDQWLSPQDRAIRAAADEESRRSRTLFVYAGQSLAARVTSAGAALRPSTQAGYRNSLDIHIQPRFGALPLNEITTAAVRQWRGQSSASGHDAAGAKAYGLLKAILQTAEDDQIILRNPCRLKRSGHAAKAPSSGCAVSGGARRAGGCDPPNWRALALVSGWCGLRIGEAAGLRRGDVDLSTGILHVAQTAQYVGTPARLVIGPPKSERGVRTVHMPQHVTQALGDCGAHTGRDSAQIELR
jgi:integrase